MGLKDAFGKLIGLEEDYDDDIEITQEEIDAEKERLKKKEQTRKEIKPSEPMASTSIKTTDNSYEKIAPMISKGTSLKSTSMNTSGPFKMLVIEPKNFEECTKLVDTLKSRKPIIINLEKVETEIARKMFDFLSGATYALNGNVQKVTSNIFIFAPANVDIAAKLNRETAAVSYGENKSPWK